MELNEFIEQYLSGLIKPPLEYFHIYHPSHMMHSVTIGDDEKYDVIKYDPTKDEGDLDQILEWIDRTVSKLKEHNAKT